MKADEYARPRRGIQLAAPGGSAGRHAGPDDGLCERALDVLDGDAVAQMKDGHAG